MVKNISIEDLISFEELIAKKFNNGEIKAPIHLYYGNEKQIIKIFKKIRCDDWVFCSWRSHYHCLLKGVPEKKVKKEILSGKSINSASILFATCHDCIEGNLDIIRLPEFKSGYRVNTHHSE